MKAGMQRFQGEAAYLIAKGSTKLGTINATGADILQLPVTDPLLAVYFPAANELITIPSGHLITLANAERLRLMADESKNGKTGPYPDA